MDPSSPRSAKELVQNSAVPVRPVLKDLNAIEASGKGVHNNKNNSIPHLTVTSANNGNSSSVLPDVLNNISIKAKGPGSRHSGTSQSSDDETYVECDSFADESALLAGDTICIGSQEDLNTILNETELLEDTRCVAADADDAMDDDDIDRTERDRHDEEELEPPHYVLMRHSFSDAQPAAAELPSLSETVAATGPAVEVEAASTTMMNPPLLDQTVEMGMCEDGGNVSAEQSKAEDVMLDQTAVVGGRFEETQAGDRTVDMGHSEGDYASLEPQSADEIVAGTSNGECPNQTVDLSDPAAANTAHYDDDRPAFVTKPAESGDSKEASDSTSTAQIDDNTPEPPTTNFANVTVNEPTERASSAFDEDDRPAFVTRTTETPSNVDDERPAFVRPTVLDQTVDFGAETVDRATPNCALEDAVNANLQRLSTPKIQTATDNTIPFSSPSTSVTNDNHLAIDAAIRANLDLVSASPRTSALGGAGDQADETPANATISVPHLNETVSVEEEHNGSGDIGEPLQRTSTTIVEAAASTENYYDNFDVSMQELPVNATNAVPFGDQTVAVDASATQLFAEPTAEDGDEPMEMEVDEDEIDMHPALRTPTRSSRSMTPNSAANEDEFDDLPPPVEEPPPFQQQQELRLPAAAAAVNTTVDFGSVQTEGKSPFGDGANGGNAAAVDEEQFEGNNIILQPDDFDFLVSKGNSAQPPHHQHNNNPAARNAASTSTTATANRAPNAVRESLLLRFDPLQQQNPRNPLNNSSSNRAAPASSAAANQNAYGSSSSSNYQQLCGLAATREEDTTSPRFGLSPAGAAAERSMQESETADSDEYCLSVTRPLQQSRAGSETGDNNANEAEEEEEAAAAVSSSRASPNDDEDDNASSEAFASASDEVIEEAATAGTSPPVSPILRAERNVPNVIGQRQQQQRGEAAATATATAANAKMSVVLIQDIKTEPDADAKQPPQVGSNNFFEASEMSANVLNDLHKSDDLEKKLREAEQREENYVRRISDKDKIIAKMNGVMEAYEKAIAELVAEKEKIIKSYEQKNADMMLDRDANFQHLTSLETTFSDLHAKYERSKHMTAQLKEAEDLLKEDKARLSELLRQQEQRYEKMKQHAIAQLEIANNKLDVMVNTHHTQLGKLQMRLKREEIMHQSVSARLLEKERENEELGKICDELINGTPGQGS